MGLGLSSCHLATCMRRSASKSNRRTKRFAKYAAALFRGALHSGSGPRRDGMLRTSSNSHLLWRQHNGASAQWPTRAARDLQWPEWQVTHPARGVRAGEPAAATPRSPRCPSSALNEKIQQSLPKNCAVDANSLYAAGDGECFHYLTSANELGQEYQR